MKDLINIFSTGVTTSKIFNLTNEQEEFIKKLDSSRNINNSFSNDLKILNKPELENLKSFCQSNIEDYFYNVLKINDRVKIYITQSWVNFNKQGESHHLHNHPNSILSGVYYVDGDNCPIIFRNSYNTNTISNKFKDFPTEYNTYNSARWWLPNTKGQLIIFPSHLDHMVEPNNSWKTRVSISFNTFISGELGSEEDLSYINLQA